MDFTDQQKPMLSHLHSRFKKQMTRIKPHHLISRKGSNAALVFWMLCVAACYVCVYALLVNHFYDAWPIIGLVLFSGLFVFFGFATRWSEKTEFNESGIHFLHTASLFKKREYHWRYEDVYVTSKEATSQQKNGNSYITTHFYILSLWNGKEKGGIDLGTYTNKLGAMQMEKYFNDIIAQGISYSKSDDQQPVPAGKPTWK
jgi:hypothetical protein